MIAKPTLDAKTTKQTRPYERTVFRSGFAFVMIPAVLGTIFLLSFQQLFVEQSKLIASEQQNVDMLNHVNTSMEAMLGYLGAVVSVSWTHRPQFDSRVVEMDAVLKQQKAALIALAKSNP